MQKVVVLHLSAVDMPTPYSSWGVKRRHLYDPIAETPLHLGTLDVDKLYHLQRPLYLGTLDLDKLYYLQRPPLAAPPADFQQPFRCCRCGHWLMDSELLFQHASRPVFCQGLKADVGRFWLHMSQALTAINKQFWPSQQ